MKLACKDLNPMSTCAYEATGNTVEEVANTMMAHATAEHADDLAKMNMTDDQKMELLKSKVHE